MGKRHILKRAAVLILGICVMAGLSGCAASEFTNIDGLLVPPKLTGEQNKIYSALEKSAGKNIRLKYPKSGEHKSAFVLQNIDDEPGEEAIVFYETKEKTADQSLSVHVKVLDKKNGEWTAVADVAGEVADVDKISFGEIPEYGKTYIAIGYSLVNQSEKLLRVYFYENEELTLAYSQGYSVLEVMDMDMDSNDELIVVSSGSGTSVSQQTTQPLARMISYSQNGFEVTGSAVMDLSVYEYVNVQQGFLYPRKNALYLDGLKDGDLYGTEILTVEDSQLVNVIYNSKKNLTLYTTREGVKCMDVNGDGIYEIPVTVPMPGYEAELSENRLLRTDWRYYMNGQLSKTMSSYVNGVEGYLFELPDSWIDQVSVKKEDSGDTVFFRYNGVLGDSDDVLLKIRSVTRGQADELLSQGYQEIQSNGQMIYLAQIPERKAVDLAIDYDVVKANLSLLY